MGRPRKTDRHDDFDAPENETTGREGPRDPIQDFENPMFADELQSPFHIPQSEWPDGHSMRWISIEVTGAPDSRNWSIKTAAKWTPVPRGKYPKIDARLPSIPMPGSRDGDGTESFIMFGGLCLCERDRKLSQREKVMQERATQEAGRTIESYVEGGNANFPRFNQSQPVQFERGVRQPQFKE